MKEKKLQIRNSTAEFLIFTRQAGEDGIEVRVQDETVWLTQKLMAALFGVDVRTISEHLRNLFDSGEAREDSVIRKFRTTAADGKNYNTQFYNLDAIIAVGFRVNSARAIQFRQWATGVLRDYAIRGYVLDKERLKNGSFFNQAYFENLLAEIREIRASERKFYQKITDIYATAMDYSAEAETTQSFFATVQNKLHFAIHGRTAAELIVERADSTKESMGLTTWRNAPHGKILKPDVVVAACLVRTAPIPISGLTLFSRIARRRPVAPTTTSGNTTARSWRRNRFWLACNPNASSRRTTTTSLTTHGRTANGTSSSRSQWIYKTPTAFWTRPTAGSDGRRTCTIPWKISAYGCCSANPAYGKALNILNKMPVNKEFVREGEAPKFTRELADEMAKHPVVC
jgi:hypothetical protein